MMWLLSSTESVIEQADGGGEGQFAKIERSAAKGNALPEGEYYVVVTDVTQSHEIDEYIINLTLDPVIQDDAYENNDTPETAHEFGMNWDGIALSEIEGDGVYRDDDYYQIKVGSGTETIVNARLYFSQEEGDLTLSLLDEFGALLDVSATITDNEYLQFQVPNKGNYLLAVTQDEEFSVLSYDLVWDTFSLLDLVKRTIVSDYDGDGVTDIVQYEKRTGMWRIQFSSGRNSVALYWGDASMVPVDGDYDGDGESEPAVYKPSTGEWFIREIVPRTPIAFGQVWGGRGMVPVPGDYNGDGVFDLAVYQEATGNWFIRSLGEGPPITFGQQWGGPGMIPVSGDFNGDNISDLAVYQESTGNWYIRSLGPLSDENPPITFGQQWGGPGMSPVPGDYNADGNADLAVYQRDTGYWFIRSLGPEGPKNPPITFAFQWGDSSMQPVPGDYDGDGSSDLAVFQNSSASWFVASARLRLILFAHPWGITQ